MRRPLVPGTAALAAATAVLWLSAGAASATPPATATSAAGTPPVTGTTPAATGTTPAATGTTPPAAAPAKAHVRLRLSGTFTVRHGEVTVPGRPVEVSGFVRPDVAGQWVRVTATVNRRRLRTERLRIKPVGGHVGGFTVTLRSPAAGILRITAVHARTPQVAGFTAQRAVAVLAPRAQPGSRGRFVDLVQQRLAALHLYLPRSGVDDEQTALALDAYHRLLGWGEGNTSLDGRTVTDLLDGRGTFTVRHPRDGRHAEGDLATQLLALVDGSRVERIYPISSGKPSTPTVLGHFRIWYRVPGYLPDGMYFSSFFFEGYAIHGYDPAPDYPASHGCMRLPVSDAVSVFNWLAGGEWVDVYL